MSYELIDTHCHLDFPEFDADRDEVVKRARIQGISYIINIGSSLEGSRRSQELTRRYENVYATAGIHPHDADNFDLGLIAELKKVASDKKVVAIGETGLDYYKNYSKPQNQKPLFESLINLAKELTLPLVVHTRKAEEDTLKIIQEAMPVRGVVHCFSGDANFLRKCLDLGFLVSFTCNLTYKKADALRELVKSTPLDRLMLETDAPFLPPEGMRGSRCEPAYVRNLAEEVSRIKEVNLEEVARITTENAKKFFKIE